MDVYYGHSGRYAPKNGENNTVFDEIQSWVKRIPEHMTAPRNTGSFKSREFGIFHYKQNYPATNRLPNILQPYMPLLLQIVYAPNNRIK